MGNSTSQPTNKTGRKVVQEVSTLALFGKHGIKRHQSRGAAHVPLTETVLVLPNPTVPSNFDEFILFLISALCALTFRNWKRLQKRVFYHLGNTS
jgi:hypothetical protein